MKIYDKNLKKEDINQEKVQIIDKNKKNICILQEKTSLIKKSNILTSFISLVIILVSCFCLFFASGCNLLSFENSESIYSSEPIEAKPYSSKEDLLASVSPAVVGILTTTNGYQSIGTGVCVSEKGYILTNNHVVEDGLSIKLYLHNNSTSTAELIWRDASLDLAVLKSSKSLPYLEMAEEGSYKAGQDVVAIGTPLSLAFKHSATKGIISALNRTIQVDNDFGESTLSNLIQHDASINPGNSGGPLIDLSGRVIGINTVKVTDAEGMGFAIPISIGKAVVQKLSANGEYNTSYLGIFGYDANLSDIGKGLNGVKIIEIKKDSPASKIGLKKGDIIKQVENEDTNSTLDLRLKLYNHEAKDLVKIKFVRDGKEYEKTVSLEEHPCCYKTNKLNFKDFN